MRFRAFTVVAMVLAIVVLSAHGVASAPWGSEPFAPIPNTAFTYQGFLTDSSSPSARTDQVQAADAQPAPQASQNAGLPANGVFDFRFELFDAATVGNQIGTTALANDAPVTDGVFTVSLDFGVTIDAVYFMEIAVRYGAETGPYTLLSPRQELKPAPFARNARLLDGNSPGSGPGNVPLNNGSLNTTLNADLLDGQHGDYYQRRVSGECAVGTTVRAINADGTVVCQGDSTSKRTLVPMNNSIKVVDSVGATGRYSSATIGADCLPLIAYFDFTNEDLKVAHCLDVTCTSATLSTVDSVGSVGWNPSITIGADGLGLISYYNSIPGNGDLKVAHCSDLACTSATVSTVEDFPNADVGLYSSITIGSDGLGFIAYYAYGFDPRVAHCDNILCTTFTYRAVGDGVASNDGLFIQVIINEFGRPYMVHYDATNGRLREVICPDVLCTNGVDSTLHDPLNEDAGRYPSMVLNQDGQAVISFRNDTWDALYVLLCSNYNGGCDETPVYVSPGGSYSSITLGTDGLPIISHYGTEWWGGGANDLEIIHCSDPACNESVRMRPDQTGAVGTETSITIGMDGLPLVSYHDATINSLKVLHCSNEICIPYFRRR